MPVALQGAHKIVARVGLHESHDHGSRFERSEALEVRRLHAEQDVRARQNRRGVREFRILVRAVGEMSRRPRAALDQDSAPRAFSLAAISGTMATRLSLAALSRKTPTATGMQVIPLNVELWHKGRL